MNPEDQLNPTATNAEVDAVSGGAVENAIKASTILDKLATSSAQNADAIEKIEKLLNALTEHQSKANEAHAQVLNHKRAESQLVIQNQAREYAEQVHADSSKATILNDLDPVMLEHVKLNLAALNDRNETRDMNPLANLLQNSISPLSSSEADVQKRAFHSVHDRIMLQIARNKVGIVNRSTADGQGSVAMVDIAHYRSIVNELVKRGDVEAIQLNTYLDGQGNRGSQHIPIEMSRSFIDRAYERYPELNLFRRIDIPSPQFLLPRLDNFGIIFRPDAPGTGVNFVQGNIFQGFDLTTGQTTLTVQRLGGFFPMTWDYEMDQDTGLDMSVMIRGMQFRFGEALAAISINGSSLATDLDNAAADGSRLWNNTGAVSAPQRSTGTRDPRFGFDGLRKETIAAAVASGGFGAAESNTFLNTLLSMRNRLDPRLSDINGSIQNAAYLCHQSAIIRLMQSNMVTTLEKAGSGATFQTGQFLQLYGVNIMASDNIYGYLAATGVANFALAANLRDRSIALLVHTPSYAHVFRGNVRLDVTSNPAVQADAVWMYARHGWSKIVDPAMVTATQIIDVPTAV